MTILCIYIQLVLTDVTQSIIEGGSFDWLAKGSQLCVDGQQKYGNDLLVFCSDLVKKLRLISLRDENDGKNIGIYCAVILLKIYTVY